MGVNLKNKDLIKETALKLRVVELKISNEDFMELK